MTSFTVEHNARTLKLNSIKASQALKSLKHYKMYSGSKRFHKQQFKMGCFI